MAKTVADILRETGLTDDQINGLDPKVSNGFTQILSTAEQAREQAELAKRSQQQQWATEIAPALDKWGSTEATLKAERDYYKTLAENAKTGGFIAEVPPFKPAEQQRNPAGQFVAGQNPTPGSPQFMTREEGFRALSNTQWVLAEYMRLNNGAVPPEDIETLANEATQQRMNLRDYAAKKYDFGAKREAIKAAESKKREDAIRAETREQVSKELAEKFGSNPNIRAAETSQFAALDRGVKEGNRPDPLKMSRQERHASTSRFVQKEIAQNEVVQ